MADSPLTSKLSIIGILSKKPGSLAGTISKNASIEYYAGAYIFTPGDEEQVIATENKFLSRDIVINPVPPTYGHIAWNGSFLTIY